ncbi:hypothetical protein KIP75_29310, partial [Pseudomonas aeruginosa]|uniref:hypothetical protein n=1 Tax=Pseudomonas aeruginosa TaxID=287 RepID=UPI001BFF1119
CRIESLSEQWLTFQMNEFSPYLGMTPRRALPALDDAAWQQGNLFHRFPATGSVSQAANGPGQHCSSYPIPETWLIPDLGYFPFPISGKTTFPAYWNSVIPAAG